MREANIATRIRVICTEEDALCGPWRPITPEEKTTQFPEAHVARLVPKGIYGIVARTREWSFRIKPTFAGFSPTQIKELKQEALNAPIDDWRPAQPDEIVNEAHVKELVPARIYGQGGQGNSR